MTREQEIFTAGFIAGLARAAHLRDPHRFPPAPNMATATALFEQAGGLEAFMTMRGVNSALDDAILALQSPTAKVEGRRAALARMVAIDEELGLYDDPKPESEQ